MYHPDFARFLALHERGAGLRPSTIYASATGKTTEGERKGLHHVYVAHHDHQHSPSDTGITWRGEEYGFSADAWLTEQGWVCTPRSVYKRETGKEASKTATEYVTGAIQAALDGASGVVLALNQGEYRRTYEVRERADKAVSDAMAAARAARRALAEAERPYQRIASLFEGKECGEPTGTDPQYDLI